MPERVEPSAGRVRWRLLLGDGEGGELESAGAWNMAVDDALVASAAAGGPPTLRFYRWRPACLSVGRNQEIVGRLEPAQVARRGWHLVRRPTGGLAVLHADEITYSVAATVDTLGRPRAAYAAVSAALAEGLRELGVEARLAGASGADVVPAAGARDRGASNGHRERVGRAPVLRYLGGGEPRCFAAAAPGEVTARGRKILGSAQRRAGRALLQHGSLLVAGSQDEVGRVLVPGFPATGSPGAAPGPWSRPRADTCLAQELPCVPRDARIIAALAAAFARRLAPGLSRGGLSVAERALAERRSGAYSSQAWTWRR